MESVYWSKVITTWKEEEKICARCDLTFNYYNSIGKWQCRQHAARDRVQFRLGDKWPCCSKEMVSVKRLESCGCVPCDHSARESMIYPGQDDMDIPNTIVDELNIPLRAQRNRGSTPRMLNKSIVVMRCDPVEYAKRICLADNYVLNNRFGIYLE